MGCWFQWFRMGGSVGLPAAKLIEFRQNSDVRSRVSIRTQRRYPLALPLLHPPVLLWLR